MGSNPSINALFKWSRWLFLLLQFFPTAVFSQFATVTGRLQDSLTQTPCRLATVVLQRTDSILLTKGLSDERGLFVFRHVPPGLYDLRITHTAYISNVRRVQVPPQGTLDLGAIYLERLSALLTAVMVTPKYPPPRLKGDTLEYSTAGIALRPAATVEDLIKRLPGVRVEPDGSIYVNGQKIEKLMINGEEFFANSPAVSTQVLNASLIGKIQVISQKSRDALLTGVNDANRTPTLNLVFKEPAAKTTVTNAQAGIGNQGYTDGAFLAAHFRGPQQAALIGMGSNTGNSGYHSPSSAIGTGLSIGLATNDPLGATAGTGIPHASGVGGQFADVWGPHNAHVRIGYQLGHLWTHPVATTTNLQLLPDSVYLQNQQNESTNRQTRQSLSGVYDQSLDSLTGWHVDYAGQSMTGDNQFTSSANTSLNDQVVNKSIRSIMSHVTDNQYQLSTIFNRTNARHNATLSLSAAVAGHANRTKGYLYAVNHFSDRTVGLATDTTDQRKDLSTTESSAGLGASYVHAIGNGASLAGKYRFETNRLNSDQGSFNKADGRYEDFIDSLGVKTRTQMITHTGSLALQGDRKKVVYNIGVSGQWYQLTLRDRLKDSLSRLRYANFSPSMDIRYTISPIAQISLSYAGMPQAPTLGQLQPSTSNADPNRLQLGNPLLKPAFSHAISGSLQYTRPLVILTTARFAWTQNDISMRTFTDGTGRQWVQPVNIAGNYSTGGSLVISGNVKPLDLTWGWTQDVNVSYSNTYQNDQISHNRNVSEMTRLTIAKNIRNRLTLFLNANAGLTSATSSLNEEPVRYWSHGEVFQMAWFLFPNIEVNGFCSYSWKEKASLVSRDISFLLAHAYIARHFSQGNWTVRLQVNNLFNQQSGISRTTNAFQTIETHSNVIGRYYMLMVSFKFLRPRPEGSK